jgi:hypothetical protein
MTPEAATQARRAGAGKAATMSRRRNAAPPGSDADPAPAGRRTVAGGRRGAPATGTAQRATKTSAPDGAADYLARPSPAPFARSIARQAFMNHSTSPVSDLHRPNRSRPKLLAGFTPVPNRHRRSIPSPAACHASPAHQIEPVVPSCRQSCHSTSDTNARTRLTGLRSH